MSCGEGLTFDRDTQSCGTPGTPTSAKQGAASMPPAFLPPSPPPCRSLPARLGISTAHLCDCECERERGSDHVRSVVIANQCSFATDHVSPFAAICCTFSKLPIVPQSRLTSNALPLWRYQM